MIPFAHLSLDVITVGTLQNRRAAVYDLINGPQYANARYAPAVAPRRPSALAGQSEYADVEDVLTLDVLGATAPQCAANLDTLLGLLDSAAEWREGLLTSPLAIRMRVPGSTVGDLEALVLGPAPGTAPATLAPTYEVPAGGGPACWTIRDVELRFIRRGRLVTPGALLSTVQATGMSSGFQRVTTHTGLTLGTVAAPAAAQHERTSGTNVLYPGLIMVGPSVIAKAAADAGAGGSFTLVNDAARNANWSPFNVLRCSTSGTSAITSGDITAIALGTSRLIGWAVTARNNDAGSTWQLRLRVRQYYNGNITQVAYSPPVIVDGSSILPQVVVVPPVPLQRIGGSGNDEVRVALEWTRLAGSGTTTIDADTVASIALDQPGARQVYIDTTGPTPLRYTVADADCVPPLVGTPSTNLTSEPSPTAAVYGTLADGYTYPAYRGDAGVAVTAPSMSMLYLATLGSVGGDSWIVNVPAQNVLRYRPAYLTPQ